MCRWAGTLGEARRAAGTFEVRVQVLCRWADRPSSPVRRCSGLPAQALPVWGRSSAFDVIGQAASTSVARCRRDLGTRPSKRIGRVRRLFGCSGHDCRSVGPIGSSLVEASCAEQGVPVQVTDRAAVEQVAVLLGADGGRRRAQARSASTATGRAVVRSATPDGPAQPRPSGPPVTPGRISTWSTSVLTIARWRSRFRLPH